MRDSAIRRQHNPRAKTRNSEKLRRFAHVASEDNTQNLPRNVDNNSWASRHEHQSEDNYESYEIIPELVEAMRQAAFANNCAFWDMYSAMGGWNSMPDWVFHEPPLAEKDFTHFSVQGANVISKMFYNAFIGRYNQYISRKK